MKFLKFLLFLFLLPVSVYAAGGEDDPVYGTPIYNFFDMYATIAFVYALSFPVLFFALWLFKSKFSYRFIVCSVFFEWISFWIIAAFAVFFRR